MFVASRQTDWDVYLQSVVYAYNTSMSATTGDSPFFLIFGREPTQLPDVSLLPPKKITKSVDLHRARLIDQVRKARELAMVHTQKAQQKMKYFYDKTAKDHPFLIGHRVWI